jgi:hypothetical protein
MLEPPLIATRLAAEEVLRNQLDNMVDVITKLTKLLRQAKSKPGGDTRNQIIASIRELNSMADVIICKTR